MYHSWRNWENNHPNVCSLTQMWYPDWERLCCVTKFLYCKVILHCFAKCVLWRDVLWAMQISPYVKKTFNLFIYFFIFVRTWDFLFYSMNYTLSSFTLMLKFSWFGQWEPIHAGSSFFWTRPHHSLNISFLETRSSRLILLRLATTALKLAIFSLKAWAVFTGEWDLRTRCVHYYWGVAVPSPVSGGKVYIHAHTYTVTSTLILLFIYLLKAMWLYHIWYYMVYASFLLFYIWLFRQWETWLPLTNSLICHQSLKSVTPNFPMWMPFSPMPGCSSAWMPSWAPSLHVGPQDTLLTFVAVWHPVLDCLMYVFPSWVAQALSPMCAPALAERLSS